MNNADTVSMILQPYKGELLGVGANSSHYAAHGPGVHLVCKSKEHACEVAAGLNAAFTAGVLYQIRKQ